MFGIAKLGHPRQIPSIISLTYKCSLQLIALPETPLALRALLSATHASLAVHRPPAALGSAGGVGAFPPPGYFQTISPPPPYLHIQFLVLFHASIMQ